MNTKQLRRKILDLAIRGKLVPQNPADEPASILLERIRAEKESLVKEGKIKRSKKDNAIIRGDDKLCYEQLPQGWAWCRLGDICDSVLGKMLDAQKNKGEYKPYLRNINVRWGDFELNDLLEMRFENDENERYAVKHGDLVICEGGESGRCAVWKYADIDMRFQKALHRVRPLCNIYPEYLCFIIRRYAQTDFLENYFTGSTIKHLTGQALATLPVPLPPLAEQHRIVAAIESAFTVIDEIERNKTDLQIVVAAAKQKILSLAIRGKLVPQDPTDEPASTLLERIRAERETLIKVGKIKKEKPLPLITEDEFPFDIPNEWAWTRLGNIISVSSGDGLTSKQMDSSGTIPVYGGNGITGYHNASNITSPILVIGRVGFYCGSTHIIKSKAWVTDNAFIVTLFDNRISLFWLKYLLDFSKIRNKSCSTAQPVISGKSLYPILIPVPPIAEQQRIVAAIETAFEQLDMITEKLS